MRYSMGVTTDEVIGANVHDLMWRRRIRQRQMCEAMGLSRSSLNKKVRGEVAWLARDIEVAAQVLEVDPGTLFAVTRGYQTLFGLAA